MAPGHDGAQLRPWPTVERQRLVTGRMPPPRRGGSNAKERRVRISGQFRRRRDGRTFQAEAHAIAICVRADFHGIHFRVRNRTLVDGTGCDAGEGSAIHRVRIRRSRNGTRTADGGCAVAIQTETQGWAARSISRHSIGAVGVGTIGICLFRRNGAPGATLARASFELVSLILPRRPFKFARRDHRRFVDAKKREVRNRFYFGKSGEAIRDLSARDSLRRFADLVFSLHIQPHRMAGGPQSCTTRLPRTRPLPDPVVGRDASSLLFTRPDPALRPCQCACVPPLVA